MKLDMSRKGANYVELRIIVPASQVAQLTKGCATYGQACQKIRERLEIWLKYSHPMDGYRQGRIL